MNSSQKILYHILFQGVRFCTTFFVLIFFTLTGESQEKKKVDILQADLGENRESINAYALIGNVLLAHEEILMWCDSAYSYNNSNKVEAFGNVHINQGDTIQLHSKRIIYNGDTKYATAIDSVRLINNKTTLYTDSLEYDTNYKIGYYENFGKIVDSTNTLTSIIGQYHVDNDLVYFYKDVHANSKKYSLISDTLEYNTKTGIINIQGPTTIQDSVNTIYSEDGWYDTETGHSELIKNPFVSNDKQSLKGDFIEYNRQNGDGIALGNLTITDLENQVIVTGKESFYNENLETITVTDSAVLILYSEEDSLFLHADTLKTIPDTITDEKIFRAYWGIRFFSPDIQGTCDSLEYFTKDSTIFLYTNPILWSELRQLTATNIDIKLNSNKADEIRLNNNSFIISQRDSTMFDQIKGRDMIGYVRENKLYKIDVDGNGQTLYYAEDQDGILGLNSAESSRISLNFSDNSISRIAFYSNIEGTLNPIQQLTEEAKELSGFEWKKSLRPGSKKDIFRK